MLIGLNFNKATDSDTKEEISVSIGKKIKGDVHVFEPRNLEEYVSALKGYKPTSKKNLVLVDTHLNLIDRSSTALMRRTEMEFARRGGVLFGEDPGFTTITYQNTIPTEQLDHVLTTAEYAQTRAVSIFKEFSPYYGRTDSDPHTLILGYMVTWPKLSAASTALLSVFRDDWWPGVGFYQTKKQTDAANGESYANLVEKFRYASVISVTEKTSEILEAAGVEHQKADPIRATMLPEARRYANSLRELARLDSLRVVE